MRKKLFLGLTLFLCVGCSNIKKIPVTSFDYQKMKPVTYINANISQQIDKNGHVANNHFEYVSEQGGNCDSSNKISQDSKESTYMVVNPVGDKLLNVSLYEQTKAGCVKSASFNKVSQVSLDNVSYHNRIYLNVLARDEASKQSGLWVIDQEGKKQLSQVKAMTTRFSIDSKTGNLYTIEDLADASYVRAYNQKDKRINQYQIRDEGYSNLFFKNGKISLTSARFVKSEAGEDLYNYLITTLSMDDLFTNLQNKSYENMVEIQAESPNAAGELKNDLLVFDGNSATTICKSDYSKCYKYKGYVEIFGHGGYLGINAQEDDKNAMYLNKFGTNGVEKILNNAEVYATHQDGKHLFFQVFDSRDESKSRTIKFTLK